jgi:hypothetical protein
MNPKKVFDRQDYTASNYRMLSEQKIAEDVKESHFWVIYGILEFWLEKLKKQEKISAMIACLRREI